MKITEQIDALETMATNPVEYLVRLFFADRRRPVARATDEAEHFRHFFHQVPGLVVHFHLHQHVTREELALAATFLPLLHFHHFFGGDKNVTELVFQPHELDALLERGFHLVLEVGVGVHDVPA